MQENSTKEKQDHVINEVMKAHFISPVNITPVPEPSDENGKVLLNGMFIDLVPLDSDFGKDAANNVEPFYKRKMFGLF
jgi:hypothetical protein